MGKEIAIDNMDDMCAMMCDNVIPGEKKQISLQDAIDSLWRVRAYGEDHRMKEAIDLAIEIMEREKKKKVNVHRCIECKHFIHRSKGKRGGNFGVCELSSADMQWYRLYKECRPGTGERLCKKFAEDDR